MRTVQHVGFRVSIRLAAADRSWAVGFPMLDLRAGGGNVRAPFEGVLMTDVTTTGINQPRTGHASPDNARASKQVSRE